MGQRPRHPRGLCRFRRRDFGRRRARRHGALGGLSAGREPACQPHPRHDDRTPPASPGKPATRPRRSPAMLPKARSRLACSRSRCSCTKSGAVLVNELAPRPHNSGHLDDRRLHHQPVRAAGPAICGLPPRLDRAPLGRGDAEPDRRDGRDWRAHLDDPPAKLHLYGKHEVKPGRKMGHVTTLIPRAPADARFSRVSGAGAETVVNGILGSRSATVLEVSC